MSSTLPLFGFFSGIAHCCFYWLLHQQVSFSQIFTRTSFNIITTKKPPEFFIFLPYPWKFQTKQSSTPRNFTKLCCLRSLGNPKAKNQDPGNSTLFFWHYCTLVPLIVIDDSSWKNAAESFTVALTLTLGGYKSAIVPFFLGHSCKFHFVFN